MPAVLIIAGATTLSLHHGAAYDGSLGTLPGVKVTSVSKTAQLIPAARPVASDEQEVLSIAHGTPQAVVNAYITRIEGCYGFPLILATLCHGVQAEYPSPPTFDPIQVTVDGVQLSQYALANNACGAHYWSFARGQLIDWTSAEERGVAWTVLRTVLYSHAQADGNVVTLDAAQQYGNQRLRDYTNDPNPNKPTIAQGETAADVFTSPAVIQAYQRALSVENEKRALVRAALGTAEFTPDQASQVIHAWFAAHLAQHQVSVMGLPAFDLATALPDGMV